MCLLTVTEDLRINFAFVYVCVRYALVLNGKETIYEALVKHSLDFSDRPVSYRNEKVFNIHRKGKVLFTVFLMLRVNSMHSFVTVYIICSRTCNTKSPCCH